MCYSLWYNALAMLPAEGVLWRVAKCLSYIEEARCLKVNTINGQNCSDIAQCIGLLCARKCLADGLQVYPLFIPPPKK